jgi:hypothetical protein
MSLRCVRKDSRDHGTHERCGGREDGRELYGFLHYQRALRCVISTFSCVTYKRYLPSPSNKVARCWVVVEYTRISYKEMTRNASKKASLRTSLKRHCRLVVGCEERKGNWGELGRTTGLLCSLDRSTGVVAKTKMFGSDRVTDVALWPIWKVIEP